MRGGGLGGGGVGRQAAGRKAQDELFMQLSVFNVGFNLKYAI